MMAARRLATVGKGLRIGVVQRGLRSTAVVRGGGGDKPPPPPFLRYQPPNYRLDENHDVVWDDGVAAETPFDFDAPHVSSYQALATLLLGGFGFFATVRYLVYLSDPPGLCPTYPRVVRVDAIGNPIDEDDDE